MWSESNDEKTIENSGHTSTASLWQLKERAHVSQETAVFFSFSFSFFFSFLEKNMH